VDGIGFSFVISDTARSADALPSLRAAWSCAGPTPRPACPRIVTTMTLRHVRIGVTSTANAIPRFVTYKHATKVQSDLQRNLLEWKDRSIDDPQTVPPRPTLISFTPTPTYTLGRRQTTPLTEDQLRQLQAPLTVYQQTLTIKPQVVQAPRGGLATYHGPGQLVLWPVIDLHSPRHTHFTVRDYVCLLEKTTIATLARFGVQGFTTDNPGVWVWPKPAGSATTASVGDPQGGRAVGQPGEAKISALGVHLRRHVTGLGVAINVDMPTSGGPAGNPWARIDACGLGDKGITTLAREVGVAKSPMTVLEEMKTAWASEFAKRLGFVDGTGDSALVEDESLICGPGEFASPQQTL
jgi:lipoyl(octanoyl) transferase 2